jgi:hypothetical protein
MNNTKYICNAAKNGYCIFQILFAGPNSRTFCSDAVPHLKGETNDCCCNNLLNHNCGWAAKSTKTNPKKLFPSARCTKIK